MGGDPAERARGAGRGDQRHSVQAVGVRAGLVHHWRRRGRAGRCRAVPVLDRFPHPGFDHAAGRGADGRRLQPVGRAGGRAVCCNSCRPCCTTGVCRPTGSRSCSASVWSRCSLPHRAGWRTRSPRISPGWGGWCSAWLAACARAHRAGAGRHDRGGRADGPLRRRDLAGQPEPDVRARYLRYYRAQRRREDDVLQRAERVRPARRRECARVRGGPAVDGPLPAGAVGGAADVPDRAGHRGAVGVRQRRDGPRALQAGRWLPTPRCARRARFRRA